MHVQEERLVAFIACVACDAQGRIDVINVEKIIINVNKRVSSQKKIVNDCKLKVNVHRA